MAPSIFGVGTLYITIGNVDPLIHRVLIPLKEIKREL
jgi:hypothetical protein